MKKLLLALLTCVIVQSGIAQYKYDNVLFKTVYIEDLCDSINKYPQHLLLDVRSKGEFYDTSSSASLNIGHLKGAKNLDIKDMETKWKELLPYKDQPVFIYCSHSQRSRVFSKFLSDSGFTKIINVNGAMTEFNLLKYKEPECTTELYETNNKFGLLSPQDVAKLMNSVTNLFILDVRTDSAFRGISTDPMAKAHGKFKGAVNIPYADLPSNLNKVPKNRPILVVADFGRETNLASKLLSENGYTQVYAAFNGMNQWMSTSAKELPSRDKLWVRKLPYTTITAEEMDKKLTASPNIFILDIRTAEEFNNQVKKDTWKNRGHIRKAVNIPVTDLDKRWNEIAGMKNKNIIVYAFGTSPEAFQAANLLTSKGFTKVEVLTGGLWDVRWKAANLKGQSKLMSYVVDVPAENL